LISVETINSKDKELELRLRSREILDVVNLLMKSINCSVLSHWKWNWMMLLTNVMSHLKIMFNWLNVETSFWMLTGKWVNLKETWVKTFFTKVIIRLIWISLLGIRLDLILLSNIWLMIILKNWDWFRLLESLKDWHQLMKRLMNSSRSKNTLIELLRK